MTAAEASALMQRGIALLEANTAASLAESLTCFEQAISVRRAGLEPGDHRAAFLLAASWMNRGDALTRLGGTSGLEEALRSYDEAIAALRAVPPEIDPLYRRRHAVAWINRGATLQAQGTGHAADAARSFEEGIAHLHGHPEHSLLLASARVNQGNALLRCQPVRATEARSCAAAALEIVGGSEEQEFSAVETGLKARLVICQAVAHELAESADPDESSSLVCAATDAVEAGLPLARRWQAENREFGCSMSGEFFRFGIAIYRRYQPQFLAEFVLDALDAASDPALLRLAVQTLKAVASRLPADGFASLHTAEGQRLLETLRALRLTEQLLQTRGQGAGADTF